MIIILKNYYVIIVLILAVFSIYLTSNYIITEKVMYNSLSEQLVEEQITKLINMQKKWNFIQYIAVILTIIIRSSLIATCLSIGMFFYNMEHSYKFKQFFRIALFGEFVLVLVGYFKLGYFYYFKTDYTLHDLQQYYPLSYINFLDLEKIQPWFVYPLQTINLFEIAYFFVLVYGLWKLLKNSYFKSLEIVAVSYGSGLFIWLGLVMFLTLNIS